jgi:hypothetical protein
MKRTLTTELCIMGWTLGLTLIFWLYNFPEVGAPDFLHPLICWRHWAAFVLLATFTQSASQFVVY